MWIPGPNNNGLYLKSDSFVTESSNENSTTKPRIFLLRHGVRIVMRKQAICQSHAEPQNENGELTIIQILTYDVADDSEHVKGKIISCKMRCKVI